MINQVVTIEKGRDASIDVYFSDSDTKLPLDLTSATAIIAKFPNDDNTIAQATVGDGVTVESVLGGKIRIDLDEDFTALLKDGEKQDWEVDIEISSAVHLRKRFPQGLNVYPSLFADFSES